VHLASTAFLLFALATTLLWLRMGLDGAIACALAQTLLNFLFFGLPCLKGISLRPDPDFFQAQLRLGLSLEAVNFLAYLGTQASAFFLAPLGVPQGDIGNFAEARKIEQTLIVTDSATPVLLSGISSLPQDQARATTARACRTLLFLQLLTALATWGALAWIYPLLLPAYTLVPGSIVFLVPGVVLAAVPKVLACYAVSVQKPLYGLWVTGASCLTATAAGLLLIPGHGIHGALAATALGYAAEAAVSVAVFRHLSGAGLLETLLVRREDLRLYGRRLGVALGVLNR
jgi:O-antigen/teichoic acid export membrane protein